MEAPVRPNAAGNAGASRDTGEIGEPIARPRAALAVVGASLFGMVVVLATSRPTAPTALTLAGLALLTVVLLAVAASFRLVETPALNAWRRAGLFVSGLLAAVPAWYFGPHSAFAGAVSLFLMLAGLLSSAGAAWLVYGGLAGGQALVSALVVARVLPDCSLQPMFIHPRSAADQAFAVAATQAVYLAAFVVARAFGKRYRALAAEVDEAGGAAAARAALVERARSEYMRALDAGRSGAYPAQGAPPNTEDGATEVDAVAGELPPALAPAPPVSASIAPPPPEALGPEPPPRPEPLTPSRGWSDAYRTKMRGLRALVGAACALAALLLWRVAYTRGALAFALVCIGGVIATGLLERWLGRRSSAADAPYWPWAVAGALSVGPAYAFGLSSSFISAMVPLLFLGGLFRAAHRHGRRQRLVVLVATCASWAVVFLLVYLRVLPDAGEVPLFLPHARPFDPFVGPLTAEALLVAAFVAGGVVDRRYATLAARAQAIARETARHEALLATTKADLDALAREDGQGIFAGHLLGRFRLGRVRGRGGMGEVYDATDVETGTRVAVKVIRHDRAADPTTLALFAREAAALARVRGPCVARVYEAGGLDSGVPYVAMEYLDGASLATLLRMRNRLPADEVREIVRDVADGLAAVHQAGMVHRDVKPHNVVQGYAGWTLIDLGVAKMHELVAGHEPGLIVGTPQYMSPEQALGEQVDARADLYSLCLIAYRALTGRPAFAGRDRLELAAAAREAGPPHPRLFVDLPADVEAVLRIGLAARADERFQTAVELREAFEVAWDGRLYADLRRRARGLLAREPWTELVLAAREEALPETQPT